MDLTAFDLKGKVALVTGGAHGIGFSIAEGMAKCGATVCFNCSNEGSLEKGLAAYKAAGIDAHGYVADVTDEAAVNAMIAQIKAEVGPVDILVNNAGLMKRVPMIEMSHTDFLRVIDINLNGTYRTGRIAHEIMREHGHGGSLIFTASLSGHNANYMMGSPTPVNAYGATKAAIMEHSRYLAAALAKDGIRSNTISPGYVWSGIFNGRIDMPGHDAMLEVVPMHRFGTNDEIASTVLFLASDASSYVTGTDIRVDGGYSVF